MNLYGRPGTPGASRGLIPLIMAALKVGSSIYNAVEANQVKQRNKGYINDAYRSAQAQQRIQEGDVRQGEEESLAARGLLSPDVAGGASSRIAAAMGAPGTVAASGSLGGRDMAETDAQLGLQRHALDAAHTQALNENNATALNSEIGAAESGIGGIAQGIQAAQEMGSAKPAPAPTPTPTPAPDVSAIGSAMGATSTHWGGVDAVDPLGAAGSNWNTNKRTVSGGFGVSNADFHL